MIFSYGFLEDSQDNARQLFLPLDIPEDDPLRLAKKRVCANKIAPGLRLAVENGTTKWESDFVYWACVNEEDGLSIEMLQPKEGPVELNAVWRDEMIVGRNSPTLRPEELRTILSRDPRWDLFHLRAAVIVQQCFRARLDMLTGEMETAFEMVEHDSDGSQTGVRSQVYEMIGRLRAGEIALLQRGLDDVSAEVRTLSG